MKNKKYKDITNQKYYNLTAIRYIKSDKRGNATWEFKCDCGNIIQIVASQVKRGNNKSCGCLKSSAHKITAFKLYQGGKYISGEEYCQLKLSAQKRNLIFNISINDIEYQFEQQNFQCYYSNLPIHFNYKNHKKRVPSTGTCSIDRIDSNQGYIKNNICLVHKDINLMKQFFSLDQFFEYIRLISIKFNLHQNDILPIKYLIISDIDGVIFYHHNTLEEIKNNHPIVLPGIQKKFNNWYYNNNKIILVSARTEDMEELTKKQLQDCNIPYHHLILGVPNGPRILINDNKPYCHMDETALSVTVTRNKGIENINLDTLFKTYNPHFDINKFQGGMVKVQLNAKPYKEKDTNISITVPRDKGLTDIRLPYYEI